MRDRFSSHLRESGLVPQGQTVLVGYSGGADSTCLLSLLFSEGVHVIAAHLHHGMRLEADEELERCKEVCDALGVLFMSGRADVPRLAREAKIGIEEAGRNARYAFFDQCMQATDAALIATAHTLDDHVETVLLNLARGSGLRGLAGIPAQHGNIVRPVLLFSRDETRAYCEMNKLWFHDDPSNDDERFSRVRVRKIVVPALTEINSAAKLNIAKCARIVDEDDRFLDGMAAAGLERAEIRSDSPLGFLKKDVEVAFNRQSLTDLPRVLLARGLRLVTGHLGAALDFHQTNLVIDDLEARGERGSMTSEGGGVATEWDASRVVCRALNVYAVEKTPLSVPGTVETDEWRIVAEETECDDPVRARGSLDVVLSVASVKPPLHVRSVQPADVISPLGSTSSKKVSEVLSGLGFNEVTRNRVPLVCDVVGPLWIPGACLAERAKVIDQESRCLSLNFKPFRA